MSGKKEEFYIKQTVWLSFFEKGSTTQQLYVVSPMNLQLPLGSLELRLGHTPCQIHTEYLHSSL